MADLNEGENPFTSNRMRIPRDPIFDNFRARFDPMTGVLSWELPETAERRRLGAEPFVKPMGEAAAPVPNVTMHEDGSATVYSVRRSDEAARLADDAALPPLPPIISESLKDMLSGIVVDSSVPPGMVVFRDEFGEVVRMVDADGEPVRVSRISTETLEETAARTARTPWNDVSSIVDEAIRSTYAHDPMRDYWETARRIRALYAGGDRARFPGDVTRDRWFTEGVLLLGQLRIAGFDDDQLSWLLPPEILGVPRLTTPASIMGVKIRLIEGIAPHLAFDLPTEAGR